MANLKYDKAITALLAIDPYNGFISEGGKLWDRLKTVAEANHCVPHMFQVLEAARKAGFAYSMRCLVFQWFHYATDRYAAELGYEISMAKDATANYSVRI